MKITRFWKCVILSVVLIGIMAYIDFTVDLTVDQFQRFAFLILLIVPITYYIFTKDVSESIALYSTSSIAFYFGVEDILYFWLRLIPIPSTLPVIAHHPVFSRVAQYLQSTNVITPSTLYLSVILGFILIFITAKFMKRLN